MSKAITFNMEFRIEDFPNVSIIYWKIKIFKDFSK